MQAFITSRLQLYGKKRPFYSPLCCGSILALNQVGRYSRIIRYTDFSWKKSAFNINCTIAVAFVHRLSLFDSTWCIPDKNLKQTQHIVECNLHLIDPDNRFCWSNNKTYVLILTIKTDSDINFQISLQENWYVTISFVSTPVGNRKKDTDFFQGKIFKKRNLGKNTNAIVSRFINCRKDTIGSNVFQSDEMK